MAKRAQKIPEDRAGEPAGSMISTVARRPRMTAGHTQGAVGKVRDPAQPTKKIEALMKLTGPSEEDDERYSAELAALLARLDAASTAQHAELDALLSRLRTSRIAA